MLAGGDTLGPDFDWSELGQAARTHGMLLPLRAALGHRPESPPPVEFGKELDEVFWAWTAKRKAYLMLAGRVASIADSHGISLILLKGPYLAERLYRPAEVRPFRDLDVLVEDAAFAPLLAHLDEAGFVRTAGPYQGIGPTGLRRWELPVTLSPREAPGLHIDLHLNLTPRLEPYRLPPQSFWAGAAPWKEGFLRLSDADALLFLFIHSLKHGYCTLLPFYDLHLAAKDPSLAVTYRDVLERADRHGFGRLIRVASELGRRLFGTAWETGDPASPSIRSIAAGFESRVRSGRPWLSERLHLLLSSLLLVAPGRRLAHYWRLSLLRPPSAIPDRPYLVGPWTNPWAGAVRLVRGLPGRRRG